MPNLKHVCPKYRKHSTGQAFVVLNGHPFYLGQYGTSKSRQNYARLIEQWEQGGRLPLASASAPLTIVELAARYLRFATKYYRAADPKNRALPGIKRAIYFLREKHGRTLASEFGPLALKAVRQRMIDAGLSRTYINDHVGRIVRMFRWAVGEELIAAEVHRALTAVDGLKRGRTEAREADPVRPVDDSTVDATIPHLPETVADMVRLQRLTGCRPAELCILRPCDLDRSGDVWAYRPARHKTQLAGKDRVIFIGPQAQAILLRYLARDAETPCFRPCDSEAKRRAAVHEARVTPLSCGNRPGTNKRRKPKRSAGEAYSVDSYRRAIHRAADKAGVERWSPNQLRHSAATEIRRRFGLEAAQVVLGHSAANVTQIYAERDFTLAAAVARQVG